MARKPTISPTADFDDFTPERLLRAEELKVARKLLSSLHRMRELRRENDNKPPLQQQAMQNAAQAQIGELAHVVLRRTCGLESLMVVRVIRDDGFETSLQIESFELMDNFAGWMSGWALSGAKLRKDGFVGSLRGHIGFRAARIERRRLDDTWERLVPKHESPV